MAPIPGERRSSSPATRTTSCCAANRAWPQSPSPSASPPPALLRCAAPASRPAGTKMWAQDFTAFDAALPGDASTYRVQRLGPFEYVTAVTPTERVLDTALADRLHRAAGGMLPVYVEGS